MSNSIGEGIKNYFYGLGSHSASIVLLMIGIGYFAKDGNTESGMMRWVVLGSLAAYGVFILYDSYALSMNPQWKRQQVSAPKFGQVPRSFSKRSHVFRRAVHPAVHPAPTRRAPTRRESRCVLIISG